MGHALAWPVPTPRRCTNGRHAADHAVEASGHGLVAQALSGGGWKQPGAVSAANLLMGGMADSRGTWMEGGGRVWVDAFPERPGMFALLAGACANDPAFQERASEASYDESKARGVLARGVWARATWRRAPDAPPPELAVWAWTWDVAAAARHDGHAAAIARDLPDLVRHPEGHAPWVGTVPRDLAHARGVVPADHLGAALLFARACDDAHDHPKPGERILGRLLEAPQHAIARFGGEALNIAAVHGPNPVRTATDRVEEHVTCSVRDAAARNRRLGESMEWHKATSVPERQRRAAEIVMGERRLSLTSLTGHVWNVLDTTRRVSGQEGSLDPEARADVQRQFHRNPVALTQDAVVANLPRAAASLFETPDHSRSGASTQGGTPR